MNKSDRDPDAIDRIRDDALTGKDNAVQFTDGDKTLALVQLQAARIAELESELRTMTSAADMLEAQKDAIGRERDQSRRESAARGQRIASLEAQLARANAKDSEKTRDINLLTQENRQQAAQLAAATERERGYVALLGDIEWVLDKEYLFRYCPECDKAQDEGHAAGCRIAAALAAAQQEAR